MGRGNHTKGNRAKAVVAALAVAITGALTGSAIVLAGDDSQAGDDTQVALSETPQPCTAGEQVVESLAPIRGENEPICLPISEDEEIGSRIDPNYTRAAAAAIREGSTRTDRVEENNFIVVCWSRDDWTEIAEWFETTQDNDRILTAFGFVSMPSNVANLPPKICDVLNEIVYEGARPDTMTASNAVNTMVHEALHTTGLADEGETECYSTQLTPLAASELSTDDAYASSLADLQQQLNHTSRAGSVYDHPDCHAGGSFDLDNDTLWP